MDATFPGSKYRACNKTHRMPPLGPTSALQPLSGTCRVCGEERGAPGKADRAALLGRLLDLPRLLDICALYGAAAAAETSSGGGASGGSSGDSPIGRQLTQLVAGALELLPRLGTALAAAGPVVAQNLGQVAEACLSAAGKAARDTAMAQSLQGGWGVGLAGLCYGQVQERCRFLG